MRETLRKWSGQPSSRWLVGLAIVTACSYGRWLSTGSPKVDQNYPAALAGGLLFGLLLLGWGLAVSGWAAMLAAPAPAPLPPRRLAYAALAIAGLALPLLSNDIYALFAYGSLAGRGRDVYATAQWLPESEFAGWVGECWKDAVCTYGPATLLLSMPVRMARGNPFLGLLILRVLWFLPLVVTMELSFRWLADRPFFHAMVWLNPLWLVEGPGQMHCDLLGMVAITASMLLVLRGRWPLGAAGYALATLGKYNFAFTGSWFWLFRARTSRDRLLRAPLLALALVALGVVLFAPLWQGKGTLLVPIRALDRMNPGGSIVAVLGEIYRAFRGIAVSSATMPVQEKLALDRANTGAVWTGLGLAMRILALLVIARTMLVMFMRSRDERIIALGTGTIVIAVTTLASHRFQPWYLLAALPFFGLACTDCWRRWWIAVVALSVTQDFLHVLPRDASLLPVWAVISTGGTVLLFVTSFKTRFWGLAAGRSPPPAPAHDAPTVGVVSSR